MEPKVGVGPAIWRGAGAALGIGIGLFVTLLALQVGGSPSTDLLGVAGVVLVAFFGAGVIGAVSGLVAGRTARTRNESYLVGGLAAAVGQFAVLACVAIGLAITHTSASGSGTSGLGMTAFLRSLFFVVPAAFAGSVAAGLMGPGAALDSPAPMRGAPVAAIMPAVGTSGAARLQTIMCPKCSAIHQAAVGTGMVFTCSKCGYSAPL
jgi:hypothetical protein